MSLDVPSEGRDHLDRQPMASYGDNSGQAASWPNSTSTVRLAPNSMIHTAINCTHPQEPHSRQPKRRPQQVFKVFLLPVLQPVLVKLDGLLDAGPVDGHHDGSVLRIVLVWQAALDEVLGRVHARQCLDRDGERGIRNEPERDEAGAECAILILLCQPWRCHE